MRKVIIGLIPIIVFSVWLYGLRVLALLASVIAAGILTEYLILRYMNGKNAKVTEAAFVSSILFTLTLPPTIPYWIAVFGIAFGIFFGKCVFGGFGKNIFNPALVGRCFIYIAFPAYMTVSWTMPFSDFPGGFVKYSSGIDALTAATPMILHNKDGTLTGYLDLFLGTVSGSIGETSALLILVAALYLIITKTASWKIMLSLTSTFIVINTIFYYTGIVKTDPLFALLSGGFLFAAVFMATDPVSAPSNDTARIVYAVLVGITAFAIRNFSLFTEGIMFAILIGNMFVPLIERNLRLLAQKGKVPA